MYMCVRRLTSNINPIFSVRIIQTGHFREEQMELKEKQVHIVKEGKAEIKAYGNVFYNPVQEFNRDLSISVLTAFAKTYIEEKDALQKKKDGNAETLGNDVGMDTVNIEIDEVKPGASYANGITILEALAASGLRSIRYAKEIPRVKQIIANDLNQSAAENIKQNVIDNSVEGLVEASMGDAIMLMHTRKDRKSRFDAIDLDPYGSPTIFLDSAVQAVSDGGLLLITATDMGVLAGNGPESCYLKYGAISLKSKTCHEMALRILLQCIESHANRYGRYIVPLLSISADFYIRVFVRVHYGQYKCKFTTSKLSMVFSCTGCDSFYLQPLGLLKEHEKSGQVKFALPTRLIDASKCEHCQHPLHMGGPIWTAPLHDKIFVQKVLDYSPAHLTTQKRIFGMLTMVLEELDDCPLYYSQERLCGTLHCETPSITVLRSAFLNAGYKVSSTHCSKLALKTNAPARVVWDVMRSWVKKRPVKESKLAEGSAAKNILSREASMEYSFELHPEANPESRTGGYLRFQMNPSPRWGPGTRSTPMVGDRSTDKKIKNQNKRKRNSE